MGDYDSRTSSPDAVGAISIREATVADRPGLAAMLQRCSIETIRHRFGGAVRSWPEPFLTDCLDRPSDEHDALVLVAPGATVGLATAASVAGSDVADISLLVEDAWQHRGLGVRALDALLARAAARGIRRLSFQITADQPWLVALARRHLDDVGSRLETGVVLVDGSLRRRP